jgi:hypothetical protein
MLKQKQDQIISDQKLTELLQIQKIYEEQLDENTRTINDLQRSNDSLQSAQKDLNSQLSTKADLISSL